jgi:hypothetical protein
VSIVWLAFGLVSRLPLLGLLGSVPSAGGSSPRSLFERRAGAERARSAGRRGARPAVTPRVRERVG